MNKQKLGGSFRELGKSKDGVVDEDRRRTQRNTGDMHTMDKAVRRVKVKNLEIDPDIDTLDQLPTSISISNSNASLPTVLILLMKSY